MIAEMPAPTIIRSISEAKAHFSAIVEEALGGKVFVICRAGRPAVTVAQYVHTAPKRRPDTLKGQIWMADDFDEMPEGFQEAFG